jgi:hypothetical protein
MKYVFVLFLTVVFFYGCGDTAKEPAAIAEENNNKYAFDTTDVATEPVENPREEFHIVYKFTRNTPYNYRITMMSNLDQQTIVDTTIDMQMRQHMIYLLQLNAGETDSDGNTELNCSITSAKVEMEGNGKKVVYISDSIKTAEERDDFAEHHSLINNPFSLTVNKNGEIIEFFRVDKLVNTYLDYKNLRDSATAEDKEAIRNQITETMLRPLFNQIFRKVPESSLAKDSVWTQKQPARSMMVFQLTQTNKFRIKDLEKFKDDKIAVIGVEIETDIQGDNKVTEQGVNYNFNRPKISAAGTIYFNIDEGYVQKVKSETNIETSVTAEAGGMKRSNKEVVKSINLVERI